MAFQVAMVEGHHNSRLEMLADPVQDLIDQEGEEQLWLSSLPVAPLCIHRRHRNHHLKEQKVGDHERISEPRLGRTCHAILQHLSVIGDREKHALGTVSGIID